jgi:DNA-binding ferritin-like protein
MSPLAQQHPNSGDGPDARMWAEAAALSVAVVKEMSDEFAERARDLGAAAEQAEQAMANVRARLMAEEER